MNEASPRRPLAVAIALTALASAPPALWFVHEQVSRLPTTAPLVLMNYDAFLWLAARWQAGRSRYTPLVVVTTVGLVLSGLFLLTLVGLCGPSVLWFDCRA